MAESVEQHDLRIEIFDEEMSLAFPKYKKDWTKRAREFHIYPLLRLMSVEQVRAFADLLIQKNTDYTVVPNQAKILEKYRLLKRRYAHDHASDRNQTPVTRSPRTAEQLQDWIDTRASLGLPPMSADQEAEFLAGGAPVGGAL